MKKMRPFLIVWVSGVVAGVVMTERWRRTGAYDTVAENDGDAAGRGTQVAADEPTVAAAIIVGAKSDAQQVWRVFTQLGKERPTAAALTKLRRSVRPVAPESRPFPAALESTPSPPA